MGLEDESNNEDDSDRESELIVGREWLLDVMLGALRFDLDHFLSLTRELEADVPDSDFADLAESAHLLRPFRDAVLSSPDLMLARRVALCECAPDTNPDCRRVHVQHFVAATWRVATPGRDPVFLCAGCLTYLARGPRAADADIQSLDI